MVDIRIFSTSIRNRLKILSLSVYIYIYVCMYMYIYIYKHTQTHVYTYIANHWSFQIQWELHFEKSIWHFKTLWQLKKKGQNYKWTFTRELGNLIQWEYHKPPFLVQLMLRDWLICVYNISIPQVVNTRAFYLTFWPEKLLYHSTLPNVR